MTDCQAPRHDAHDEPTEAAQHGPRGAGNDCIQPPEPHPPHRYQGTDAIVPKRLHLAYADPPYLGCCARYEHRHEAPWGCWDDLKTHQQLIEYLGTEYPDGWALSATSVSLRSLLPLSPPDARVAAWVKTWCSFKTSNPAYAWEPVIFCGGRSWAQRGKREAWTIRDWLAASVTTKQPVIGAKPERFCRWVLDLLGYRDGDTVDDLFPGTGVMSAVLAQGVLA